MNAEVDNLSKDATAKEIVPVPITSYNFITATQDFSINLFKQSVDFRKNSLVSPTSVILALGMTANGSNGRTLDQFLQVLGKNYFTINQLNYSYYNMSSILYNDTVDSVYGNPLKLANSIWYRNDLNVYRSFIRTNEEYYKADIFSADFNSPNTVNKINNWVYRKTNGLIDNIIDEISGNTVMYLINTLLFEAEWQNQFAKEDATIGSFKDLNDVYSSGIFFNSANETFLKGENATGFIKPYKGGKYSFVAMLPNEQVSINDFIQTLDAKSFQSFIGSKNNGVSAQVCIPKFEYSFDAKLVEPLKRMGLVDAFDPDVADFSNMANPSYGIYIKDILHKTYIQLSEVGTKAGAVTKVEMAEKGIPSVGNKVILDRPFVYAIVENTTNLPIFIGTVVNPF